MIQRLKRRAILWFISTDIWYFLMYKIFPYIRFSMYYTSFKGWKYHQGYKLLQPGMMVGAIDTKKMTGKAITQVSGGILAHVGFCIHKRVYGPIPLPPERKTFGEEIVEMTHDDYTFSDFFDICKEAERVIIFDCLDWSADYKTDYLIPAALSFHEARYDIYFEFGIKALYCSELILQSDKLASYHASTPNQGPRIKASTGDLMGLGREYISPDGLLTAENVRVIWDSKDELTGKTGPELKKLIFGQKDVLP